MSDIVIAEIIGPCSRLPAVTQTLGLGWMHR